MRRMFSEKQLKEIAVKTIENAESLQVFENITDKDGHKRFLEGALTTPTIEGVNFSYAKWSLSGTHLMLVVAFNIEDNASISAYARMGETAVLPDWIRAKIVSATGSAYGNISVSETPTTDNYAFIVSGYNFNNYLQETAEGTLLISALTPFTNDTGNTIYCRIQYDLLIDND